MKVGIWGMVTYSRGYYIRVLKVRGSWFRVYLSSAGFEYTILYNIPQSSKPSSHYQGSGSGLEELFVWGYCARLYDSELSPKGPR